MSLLGEPGQRARVRYRETRRPITASTSIAEHAQIAALAKAAGKPPTTYVTELLRQHLAEQPMIPARKIASAEVA
jgi:hypothetical protein